MRRSASQIIRNLEQRIARLEKQSNMSVGDYLKSELESIGWRVGGKKSAPNPTQFSVDRYPVSKGGLKGSLTLGKLTMGSESLERLVASYKEILSAVESRKAKVFLIASEIKLDGNGSGWFSTPDLPKKLGVGGLIPSSKLENRYMNGLIESFVTSAFLRNKDFQDEAISRYQSRYWGRVLKSLSDKYGFELNFSNLENAREDHTIGRKDYEEARGLLSKIRVEEKVMRNNFKRWEKGL